jgi:hypothetical protein
MTKKRNSSAAKKLIPAAGMLAVSAMMLASSTYAWFTMNKTVEVTGMEVKTKVGDNLLICTTNLDADYSSLTLSQSRKALLEPVSSINGATGTFYYTTDAKANGDAVSDAYTLYNEVTSAYAAGTNEGGYTTNPDAKAGKNSYMGAFNAAYGNTVNTTDDFGIAYGYVDYTFYIKATSSAAGQKIVMSECNLDYAGGDIGNSTAEALLGKEDGPDRAWRVAVFANNVTETSAGKGVVPTEYLGGTSMATAENQKGLIALANAVNQTANTAVDSTTTCAGTVLNNASANGVVIATLGTGEAPNQIGYYKVIVRLWLEGEDNTCTSETYAKLTDAYKLDLQFKIVDSTDTTTAVKVISADNAFAASTATTQAGDQYDVSNTTAGG